MRTLLPTFVLSGVFLVIATFLGGGVVLGVAYMVIIPYVLIDLYRILRANGKVGVRPVKTFIWVLSVSLACVYHFYFYKGARNFADDAAAKIVDYRSTHGVYPDSLEIVGVENNSNFFPTRLMYSNGPSGPDLAYPDTFLPFHVNFYDFGSGKWWTREVGG